MCEVAPRYEAPGLCPQKPEGNVPSSFLQPAARTANCGGPRMFQAGLAVVALAEKEGQTRLVLGGGCLPAPPHLIPCLPSPPAATRLESWRTPR